MHGIKKFAASAALVALSVVGLAGCGGGSPTPTTAAPTATTAAVTEAPTATTDTGGAPRTTPTAATADATTTTSSGAGGTGSDDALGVLRQSATAMKDINSYHIVLTSEAGGKSTTSEGDIE